MPTEQERSALHAFGIELLKQWYWVLGVCLGIVAMAKDLDGLELWIGVPFVFFCFAIASFAVFRSMRARIRVLERENVALRARLKSDPTRRRQAVESIIDLAREEARHIKDAKGWNRVLDWRDRLHVFIASAFGSAAANDFGRRVLVPDHGHTSNHLQNCLATGTRYIESSRGIWRDKPIHPDFDPEDARWSAWRE